MVCAQTALASCEVRGSLGGGQHRCCHAEHAVDAAGYVVDGFAGAESCTLSAYGFQSLGDHAGPGCALLV